MADEARNLPGFNHMELNGATMCKAVQEYLERYAQALMAGAGVTNVSEDRTNNVFRITIRGGAS